MIRSGVFFEILQFIAAKTGLVVLVSNIITGTAIQILGGDASE